MSTETYQITVRGQVVDVVRKKIKNLHIAVYPPTGRLRAAVPLHVNDEAVRLAVITRLGWIKRHKERILAQERQSPREYVTGESHYFRGRRYRLDVVEGPRAQARVRNNRTIELQMPPRS